MRALSSTTARRARPARHSPAAARPVAARSLAGPAAPGRDTPDHTGCDERRDERLPVDLAELADRGDEHEEDAGEDRQECCDGSEHASSIASEKIRDVLLDRHPIFWLEDSSYLMVIVASALLTVGYVRWRPAPAAALLYADAVGLALFSITGAQIAERAGVPAVGGIVLGTITGAAGGAVRDVLSAEIPYVLRRGNLYASAAILGTGVYFLAVAIGVPRSAATWAGMLVIAGVRLASIAWRLQLPVFELDADGIPARDRTSDAKYS